MQGASEGLLGTFDATVNPRGPASPLTLRFGYQVSVYPTSICIHWTGRRSVFGLFSLIAFLIDKLTGPRRWDFPRQSIGRVTHNGKKFCVEGSAQRPFLVVLKDNDADFVRTLGRMVPPLEVLKKGDA